MANHTRRIGRIVAAGMMTGSVLMLTPGPAHAGGADVTTDRFVATDTIPAEPCPGITGQATITFKGVFHTVERPTEPPTGMFINNLTGTFVFAPDDPASEIATGHFTAINVGAAGTNVAFTDIVHTHGTTADGSKLTAHSLFHLTENGIGVTVVDLEMGTCHAPPSPGA